MKKVRKRVGYPANIVMFFENVGAEARTVTMGRRGSMLRKIAMK